MIESNHSILFVDSSKNQSTFFQSQPRFRQDHPVDLSILLTGGKETN